MRAIGAPARRHRAPGVAGCELTILGAIEARVHDRTVKGRTTTGSALRSLARRAPIDEPIAHATRWKALVCADVGSAYAGLNGWRASGNTAHASQFVECCDS